jgi:DNA-binding transcriptional ArsR family regulator
LRAYKASVFQALVHPTRIAVEEFLRDGELSGGACGKCSAWLCEMAAEKDAGMATGASR